MTPTSLFQDPPAPAAALRRRLRRAGTCCAMLVLPALSAAQAVAPALTTTAPPTTLLRLGLNPHTQLVFEPRQWQALPADPLGAPPKRATLGLEFHTVNKAESPRQLLSLQISGDASVQFRPRGGGVGLVYRSPF